MRHLPFKSTRQQRMEWISSKTWHCRTSKHFPGLFNKGEIARIHFMPKGAAHHFTAHHFTTHPRRVSTLWLTFPPEATAAPAVSFLQQESYFCCKQAGSDVTGPSSSSVPGSSLAPGIFLLGDLLYVRWKSCGALAGRPINAKKRRGEGKGRRYHCISPFKTQCFYMTVPALIQGIIGSQESGKSTAETLRLHCSRSSAGCWPPTKEV